MAASVQRRYSLVNGFCFLLPFFLPGAAWSDDDLVIGMSAAFTGPSRGLSIELYRGSMAYFEDVNQSGEFPGRKIVIKAYDDGYDPARSMKNTIRLIEQDQVFLLYGYMGTPTTTRILPLLKRYSSRGHPAYLFFPFSGAQPLRQPPYDEFVFNLRASYRQETAGLVKHFVEIGRKRIAIFYQIDAYGRSGWDGVRSTLADNGLRLAEEATYKRGTKYDESLTPQVNILRRANPDAVISVGTYSACAAFIRDARDAGWDVPIANVSGVDSENLLRLLRAEGHAKGKDYTAHLINSEVVPSYDDTTLPAVAEYRRLMDRYRPRPPESLLDEPYDAPQYSCISLEGFLNAKLLAKVLKEMGPDLKREHIQQVVESIGQLDLGIDAPISFGADRHQGLERVYYMVVSRDRFVPLKEEDWKGRWGK